MKKLLLSSLLAAGAFSMFSACSDDPVTASSPIAAPTSSDSGYPGTSSSSSAFAPIPGYSSAIVPGSSGSNPLSSSSVVAPVPGSSSSVVNPSQSSSSVNPTSSATPGSSAVESSSSAEPAKTTGNPEEDIKLYPVPTLKNILGNGTSGWNTRYWDACKAHCSQTSTDGAEGKPKINTQEEYAASHYTARVCNINDIEIPTFTYSKGLERYWIGIQNTPNACQEADPASGGGFTCTDMAPVAVNDRLHLYRHGPCSCE